MAASKTTQQATIGSLGWLAAESSLAQDYISQEVEDFSYSVRNEFDWLNEHMAGIFDGTQFDVIEAFKTPGKLRGKTPHTARRIDHLGNEAISAPVFAQPPPAFKLPSPVQKVKTNNFEVAEDVDDEHVQSPPQQARFSINEKENAQSGPVDEFKRAQATPNKVDYATSASQTSSVKVAKLSSPAPNHDLQPTASEISHDADFDMADADVPEDIQQAEPNPSTAEAEEVRDTEQIVPQVESEHDMPEQDDLLSSSPSHKSTPEKSVLRKKSSLTFATLPARDPITTKKSMGPRISRLSQYDQTRPNAVGRESHLGERPGQLEVDDEMEVDEEVQAEKKTETSKTSTQRLHERLAMLRKSAQPRPSKSIPDDDWIGPISNTEPSLALQSAVETVTAIEASTTTGTTNTAETNTAFTTNTAATNTTSPVSKLPVVSYPRLVQPVESTTPAGSPSRNKLFSVLEKAKGLFVGGTTAEPPRRAPGVLREPAAAARPAAVPIKLASQRVGQEALPVPVSSLRAPTLVKKASSASIQTSSSRSTAPSTAPSTAASRAAEQKRALEAKNAAQRQAAEQRRAEAIRRNEQLRQRAAKPPRAAPPVNKAKPAKRQFNDEDADDEAPQPSKQEPKRRRTSQLEPVEGPSRPTMAPPIRPSNVHKQEKHIHTFTASSTTTAPSMFKSTVTAQHNLHHAPKTPHYNDLAKFSSAKIPFADGANRGPNTTQKVPLKTPGATLKTPGTAKQSPQYPSGENIELPDIATDSDDDDEDDGDKAFVPPDWAASPALRELLRQQQLVDPMQVFGPIAPLVMEEVFKGNKERQARFRNRTSSAVWTRDQLTADEVRRDREARERLEREGGWSFRPGQ